MKKHIVISSLLLVISISSSIAQNKDETRNDDELVNWVEKYMEYAVKHDHFGGVILLAHNGTPVFEKAYGMASYELEVSNTLDTKFRIGSVSKTFTAAAILLLQQQNNLNIDNFIGAYLKDCPSQWKEVTIRQLLNHTSGIVSYTSLPEASGNFLLIPHSQEEVIDLFRNQPLESNPGEKFNYNNSAYYLLGVIVEQVSGKTYEQFLKDHFFTPLKMENTGLDHNEIILKNSAFGYRQVNDSLLLNTFDINMDNLFSIGGLYSTVSDLLLWDQAFYSNQLFNQSTLDEIFTVSINSHYGLGWIVDSIGDCSRAYHDGGITDFSASIQRLAEKRITVIAISNRGNDAGIIVAYDIVGKICGYPATIRGIQDKMEKLSSEELFDLFTKAKEAFSRFRITEKLVDEVAVDLEKQGNLNQAIEVYKLNTLLYPQSDEAFLTLGVKYLITNNSRKAEESFKKCLRINPRNVKAKEYLKEN